MHTTWACCEIKEKKKNIYGYIKSSQCYQLPVGLLAQLVEYCIGLAEAMGSGILFRSECFLRLNFT